MPSVDSSTTVDGSGTALALIEKSSIPTMSGEPVPVVASTATTRNQTCSCPSSAVPKSLSSKVKSVPPKPPDDHVASVVKDAGVVPSPYWISKELVRVLSYSTSMSIEIVFSTTPVVEKLKLNAAPGS